MSKPTVVLLEGAQAWVLPARGALVAVPCEASGATDDVPDLAPVRDALLASGAPRDIVLVIGGAWLECARPALPPLATVDRRRALHHQADRFFPTRGAVASTVYDDVAIACDAAWLRALREQWAAWGMVRAVLGLPEAAAAAGLSGAWHAEAARRGTAAAVTLCLELRAAAVTAARVVRGGAPAGSRPLERDALLRAVQQRAEREWPRERQLLDVTTDDALARAQQRAWWRAAALLAVSLGLLAWATGQYRERQLVAADAAQQRATTDAAAALAAQARLLRAQQEHAWLAQANQDANAPGTPSRVIATLGQLIPPTAFVQRLEWDGQQWKIDGSAVDAAALVPRLDEAPAFEQVRSLAPSTRFLDGGTPRSSFSIGFRVRDRAPGAAAAPTAATVAVPTGGTRGER